MRPLGYRSIEVPHALAACIGAAILGFGVLLVLDYRGAARPVAKWNRRVWSQGLSTMRGPTTVPAVRATGIIVVVVGTVWVLWGLFVLDG